MGLAKLGRRGVESRGFLGWPSGTVVPSNGDIPSPVSTLSDVGIDSALRLAGVWACVRLLADLVSTMPLRTYRWLPDGSRKRVDDGPLVTRPSARYLPTQWRYQMMVSLLLRGNAYGWITQRDALMYPTQVEWLHPDLMDVIVDPVTGTPTYFANGTKVDPTDLLHIPAFMLPGWPLGLSPITYASMDISTGLAAGRFANDYFSGGGHPSTVVYSDQKLDATQAQDIKRSYVKATVGREPAVLGSGLRVDRIQIAPNESQFLETIQANKATIASFFGVPGELVGAAVSGSSVTYANREQRAQDLLTFSVNGWLVRIEEAISAQLPGKVHVQHDTSGLLKSDLLTRFKAWQIGIDAGFATPNQAAMGEGWEPFDGGDVHNWPPKKAAPEPPAGGTGDQAQGGQ